MSRTKAEIVRISKGSGKMEGIRSINTNPLTNKFCQRKSSVNDICSRCYSKYMLTTMRQNCVPVFEHNSKALQGNIVVPVIKDLFFRFHSHGELLSKKHYRNFVKIAEANPGTWFALWTKRLDLVTGKKPSNMFIMYSNPKIDEPMALPHCEKCKKLIPKKADGIFNVVTQAWVDENQIQPNCGGKCRDCMACYGGMDKPIILEVLKKYKK